MRLANAVDERVVPGRVAVEIDPRRLRSDDAQLTERRAQLARRRIGYVRPPAQEEDAQSLVRRALHQRHDQIGSRDLLRQATTEQSRCPQHRHAVDERERRIAIRGAQPLVVLDLHDVIDVRREDRSAFAASDQRDDRIERLLERERIDLELSDSNAIDHGFSASWMSKTLMDEGESASLVTIDSFTIAFPAVRPSTEPS